MIIDNVFLTKFRINPFIALCSLYSIEDSELWLSLFCLLPFRTQKYLLKNIGFRFGKYEELKELYYTVPDLRDTIAFVYARQFLYNLYCITHTFERHPDPFFEGVLFDSSVHIHMPKDDMLDHIRKQIRSINRTTGVLAECTNGYSIHTRKILKSVLHAKERAPLEPFDQREALCLLYPNPPSLIIKKKMGRRCFNKLNNTLDKLFDTYIEGMLEEDDKDSLLENVIYNLLDRENFSDV